MTASTPRGVRKPIHIWDACRALNLRRVCPVEFYSGKLDPGVNYFILQLERLGAETSFSCEGHPDGFYVVFSADMALARRIASCGFFGVEISGETDWSLRFSMPHTKTEHRQILRLAAAAWERVLGPLDLAAVKTARADRPFRQKTACR